MKMIKQQDLQRCPNGCCLYLEGRPVGKAEYDEVAGKNLHVSGSVMDTVIPCLTGGANKIIAEEAGIYLGRPVTGGVVPTNMVRFVYDATSHECRGIATNAHTAKVNAATRNYQKREKEKAKVT
jgi:hypothetical protein